MSPDPGNRPEKDRSTFYSEERECHRIHMVSLACSAKGSNDSFLSTNVIRADESLCHLAEKDETEVLSEIHSYEKDNHYAAKAYCFV